MGRRRMSGKRRRGRRQVFSLRQGRLKVLLAVEPGPGGGFAFWRTFRFAPLAVATAFFFALATT